jgi:prolyl-tRNA editing enzyme YbaK/EbsC (Cys-tRNA(Pro) deacylase)
MQLGTLDLSPALEHLDEVGAPVRAALEQWEHAGEVLFAAIDPELADTATMSEAYGTSMEDSANCVVIMGKRAGEERIAAAMVRADTRADVNTVVRGLLDVRKCSFLDHGRAVEETGMEHGGITPIGLPADWRILVDERVADIELAIIGAGVRGAKLFLPGRLLGELPGAEVVPGLAH